MKYFLTAAALLLATLAIAQPQTKRLPVMYISDPDLYLEENNPVDDPAPSETGFTTPRQGSAELQDPLPEYLLRTAMWSDLYPGELMQTGYGTYFPLNPKKMSMLILEARARPYEPEK